MPDEDNRNLSDDEFNELLRDALTAKLKEKKKLPKRAEVNNAIVSTLGEFMSCFKIIGYDLNGDPINITAFKEKIEKSALDNAFMEEIGRFMGARGLGNDRNV